MTALIIVGCILLLVLLVGMLRLGVSVDYSESGLVLILKAGPVKIRLMPSDGKRKTKKKAERKPDAAEKQGEKPGIKDTLTMVREFLPLIGEAAGRLKKKIRIDEVFLNIIWGSSDPAAAAIGYGAANAVLGTLWPIIEYNFQVKRYELHVNVDYERTVPAVVAKAQVTLTVRQFLAFLIRYGIKGMKIYLGSQRNKTKEKAVQT